MRTDRTTLCLRCRVRLWPVRRCPVCGDDAALLDLREEPDGEGVEASAQALDRPWREPAAEEPEGALRFGLLLAAVSLAALAGLGLLGLLGGGEPHLVVMLFLLAGLALLLFVLSRRAAARREGGYRLLEGPVLRRGVRREAAEGEVVGAGSLRAPLSGEPCVAFRLVGEGPLGPIDDSLALDFGISRRGAPPLWIHAAHASIDLPLPAEGEARELRAGALRAEPELLRFLRERGADPRRGRLRLRESLLRAGDRVAVEGSPEGLKEGSGYRLGPSERALGDAPGSPLRVRLLRAAGGSLGGGGNSSA